MSGTHETNTLPPALAAGGKTDKMPPTYVSQSRLASALGYSRTTLWRMIRDGQIKPAFGQHKSARFDLEATIASLSSGIKAPWEQGKGETTHE